MNDSHPDNAPEPTLCVVIPVYNERSTVQALIERVQAVDLDKHLVVVDDASTDGTREVLERLAEARGNLTLCRHEVNRGKGAALRTGFANARGRIVLVQDADLEYDPAEHPKLIRPIVEDRADVVFGSRFVSGESRRVLYFWHAVGNTCLTLLSNMLTNLNLTDMETCFKAFRREVIQSITIEEDRFGFEPEVTAKVAKLRRPDGAPLRIYEVGIAYAGRTYAEGKKITWRDGLRALWCILKYGLRPGRVIEPPPDRS